MMLTVHGLPPNTKFQHVKTLIKQECNIPDFILDNLVEDEFNSKKIRIGLTNENDGYQLMKCLQGFRMSGSHVLRISRVGDDTPAQSQTSFDQISFDQISNRPASESRPQQQSFERSSYNQPRNDYKDQSHADYPDQDYNRSTNIQPSHISPHSSARPGNSRAQAQPDRDFVARQSMSALPESRQNRFQDSDRRPDASEPSQSDYRAPNRRPLASPAIRPVSLDGRLLDSRKPTETIIGTHQLGGFGSGSLGVRQDEAYRGPSLDTRGPNSSYDTRRPNNSHATLGLHGSHNTQELRSSHSTQGSISSVDSRPIENVSPHGHGSHAVGSRESNLEMNRQPQWTTATNAWTAPTRPTQNQNMGYNYQQPQGSLGYGQQPTPHRNVSQPYQAKAPLSQQYQQPKIPAMSGVRQQAVRSVEIVDKPIQPRAAPVYPPQQKPITIMKDNFQGPTQYNVTGQVQPTYRQAAAPATSSPWAQPVRQVQSKVYDKPYEERRMDKSKLSQDYDQRQTSPGRGRMNSPGRRSPPRTVSPTSGRAGPSYPERRTSPPRPFPDRLGNADFNSRRKSPSKSPSRRISPNRKVSPLRRLSPRRSPVRKISPFGRKISPWRRVSPGRRLSPPGKRVSPGRHSPGRRVSPERHSSGRRVSPGRHSPGQRVSPGRHSPGRRVSPGRRSPGRRVSPGRRISPFGKRLSPGTGRSERRISPSMTRHDYYVEDDRRMESRQSPQRYSPKRSPPRGSGRYSPNINFETDKGLKPIRPAYEASKAQKYTGPASFRANEPQYPAVRSQPNISPWQTDKTVYPSKKEDREPPRDRPVEKKPPRQTRSRSPVKDRYRHHSPSPRSPRRSWALEKRGSPEQIREPPPPPLWPGQEEEKPKVPVWERPDTRFDSKRDDYTRYSPKRDDSYRGDDDRGDYRLGKEPPAEKKLFNEIDKDFEDIYQRAVELRRKTEERKSHDRRIKSYDSMDLDKETPSGQEKKPVWIPIKIITKDIERKRLEPHVKEKRDKAIAEIATRILEPHDVTGDNKHRLMEELKKSLWNILMEMFDDKDVSYIELVIKFRARYDAKDEEKILQKVMAGLPSHCQNMLKRKGVDHKYSSEHSSSKLKCRHKERKRSEAINQDAVLRSEIGKERHSSVEYKKSEPKEYARESTKVYESKPHIYQEGKHKDVYKESQHDTYHGEKRKRTLDSKHSYHQDEKLIKCEENSPDTYNYEEGRKILCHTHKKEKQLVYADPKPYNNQHFETKQAYLAEMHAIDYVSKSNDKDDYYEEASSYEESTHEVKSDIEHKGVTERDEAITDDKEKTQREVIELSPTVAKIVEDELRDLMIKVWETLPDDPNGPAERLVVGKLNQEAGDDLRNTLGLSIVQRMLDVNNQFVLLIEMSSSDYKSGDRIEFAKQHRLSYFNRLRSDVFVARVRRWDDYQKFYKPTRWMCGKARCKITPLFDFTRRPDNVKTVFDGSQDYSDAKKLEKKAASKLKQLAKPVLTADQVLAKSKTNTTKRDEQKTVHTKTANKENSAKKNITPKITKVITAKDVLSKSTNSVKSDNKSKLGVANTAYKRTTETLQKNYKKPVTPHTKDETVAKKLDSTVKEESNQQIVNNPVANIDSSQKANVAKKPETKKSTAEDTKAIAKTPAKPVAKVAAATEKVVVKEATAIASKPIITTAIKVPTAVTKAPAETVAKESKPAATIPVKTITKTPSKTAVAKDPAKPAESGTAIAKETKTLATVTKVVPKDAKSAATATIVAKPTVAKAPAKTIASASVVKQQTVTDVKVTTQTVVNPPTKAIPKPTDTNKEFKTQTKTDPKQSISTIVSPVKKAKENDFDELDDNDILCMLSGGIVLDECSGSDED